MSEAPKLEVRHGLGEFLRGALGGWDLVNRDQISAVTVLLTYTCPAACAHCVFESSPKRRETVDLDVARKFIEAASRQDPPPTLSFSGGEPFIRLDMMQELASMALSHGMPSEVISSSAWATSDARAHRVLADMLPHALRQAGEAAARDRRREGHRIQRPRQLGRGSRVLRQVAAGAGGAVPQ